MKLLKLFLLFFLTIFSVNTFADDKEDLNRLLNDYVKAVNDLDLNLAKKIWSQKASISFIQPRGHQKGWEDIEKAFYLGAMGNFKSRELTLKNININILSKDTAWSEFYWDFNATFKTVALSKHLVEKLKYIKRSRRAGK